MFGPKKIGPMFKVEVRVVRQGVLVLLLNGDCAFASRPKQDRVQLLVCIVMRWKCVPVKVIPIFYLLLIICVPLQLFSAAALDHRTATAY